jgi:predicted regulator of Ras-like GTPase activity (Roadblock/LC7/MglB family)
VGVEMEALKRLLGLTKAQIFEEKLTEMLTQLRERTSGAEVAFLTKPNGLLVAESHIGPAEMAMTLSAVGAEIAEVSAGPITRLLASDTKHLVVITDQATIGLARLQHELILGIAGTKISISWMLKWLSKADKQITDLFDSTFRGIET